MLPRRRVCTRYRIRSDALGAFLERWRTIVYGVGVAGCAFVVAWVAGFLYAADYAHAAIHAATVRANVCQAERETLANMLRESVLRQAPYTLHLHAPSLSALGDYAARAAAALERDASTATHPALSEH